MPQREQSRYAEDHRMSVPFGERGGALRGAIDLLCGRLPRFVFGGPVGSLVPVFHFHDEPRAALEPAFRYLRENGYRTLAADDLATVARGRRAPAEREVALCFDDAWATVWTDAAPLLRDYGLQAIVYAIPGRVAAATGVRAQAPASRPQPRSGGTSPFMTWPELRQLHAAGTIDVQSHTWTHARVFTSTTVVDFVRPGWEQLPALNRPLLHSSPAPEFVQPSDLGAPLYEHRSRMSDGRRVRVSLQAHDECVAAVRAGGGEAFFARPDWRATLDAIVQRYRADLTEENAHEQRRAIEEELDRSRSELNARLGTTTVRHVCFPWGVAGSIASDAVRRLGFDSAIANRWSGVFAVRPGDDPYWLKRLPNRYITALPGRGRRTLVRRLADRLSPAPAGQHA